MYLHVCTLHLSSKSATEIQIRFMFITIYVFHNEWNSYRSYLFIYIINFILTHPQTIKFSINIKINPVLRVSVVCMWVLCMYVWVLCVSVVWV